jgi:acyl carrier protein
MLASRVKSELVEFIVTNFLFGDVARTPRDEESLVESGIVDSTGILELVSFVEDQFGIVVSEEETLPQNLDSLDNLTRFVTAKQAAIEPSR